MALSDKLKKELRNAISDQSRADELITAIEASVASPAANVPDVGPLSAVPGSLGAAAAKSDLDTLQASHDAMLDAIKAAGLMIAD